MPVTTNTKIQWTDHTFNPWWGCEKVSPGCANCYAESFAARFGTKWGHASPRRFFTDKHWNEPLKWNKLAHQTRTPARVFCASMADVFEDRRDLDEHRARLFTLIRLTTFLEWQLLTKRPENMRRLAPWGTWPENVWAGTSVESQEQMERVEHLAKVPAAIKFISAEPLLGPIEVPALARFDWVIVGGESGSRARPLDVAWVRSIVEACRGAGVAPFVKQLGAYAVLDPRFDRSMPGWTRRLSDPKGGDPEEWPEDLRVREFPK